MYNHILGLSLRKCWVILFVSVFLSVYAEAQSNNYSYFDTDTPSSPANVRVRYNVSQGISDLMLQVEVDTPLAISIHIIDNGSKEMTPIETVTLLGGYGYGRNIDLSYFPTGAYYIEFLYGNNNNQRRYRVPFYKE